MLHCPGGWTRYYDHDNPGGNGDFERLSDVQRENPNDVCENPVAADARQVGTHVHYTETGQILTIGRNTGITCQNRQQPGRGRCFDYEVRFCCPFSSKSILDNIILLTNCCRLFSEIVNTTLTTSQK